MRSCSGWYARRSSTIRCRARREVTVMAIGVEKTEPAADGLAFARPRPRLSELQRGVLLRTLSVVVTLALWEWYGRGVDPIFLSYPSAILAAVPRMLASGELSSAFWISLQGLVVGIALAIGAGVLLGLLTGRYRT